MRIPIAREGFRYIFISVALGIPMTILWSTEGAGLGSSGVTDSDERKFYQQAIIPQAKFIAGVMNQQSLEALGYRLIFRPETLDIFQEDESQRASAFKMYVDSGLRRGLVAQMVGLELPPGVEYDDLDEQYQEDKEAAAARMPNFGNAPPNPQQNQQNPQREAMRADLVRWRTKARKAGGVVPFESEFIPPALMESINGSIQELGVEEAFEFLKKKS